MLLKYAEINSKTVLLKHIGNTLCYVGVSSVHQLSTVFNTWKFCDLHISPCRGGSLTSRQHPYALHYTSQRPYFPSDDGRLTDLRFLGRSGETTDVDQTRTNSQKWTRCLPIDPPRLAKTSLAKYFTSAFITLLQLQILNPKGGYCMGHNVMQLQTLRGRKERRKER